MKKKKVWHFFLVALFVELTKGSFSLPLLSFSPFFALAYSRQSKRLSLALAAMIGLVMDCLSADYPFGFHTFTYTLVTLLLYRQRIYFVDRPIGLCSFTFVLSLAITALERALLPWLSIDIPLTWRGFLTDFMAFPLIDALYALVFFALPPIIYRQLKKSWFRFLFFVKTSTRKNSRRKEASR